MDDRKRRAHWGDIERSTYARRKTEPGGIPVEVDEEGTPPPCEAPRPEDFETLSLPAQVQALHRAVTEQAEGLGRVWPGRHDSARIDKIGEQVSLIASSVARLTEAMEEFVKPAIRTLTGTTGALWGHYERNKGREESLYAEQLPRLVKSIDGLADQFKRFERSQDRHGDEIAKQRDRQTTVEHKVNDHEVRLTALESRHTESVIRSDERRRLFTKGRLAFAAIGAVITALITKGPALIAWLSK